MSKSDLKENVLAARLEGVLKWILDNRPMVLTVLGGVVAAAMIGSVFVIRNKEKSDLDWTQISRAQSYMGQNKNEQATEILKSVHDASPDKDARLQANFYLAEISLSEKKSDDAIHYLNDVVSAGSKHPIRPLAFSNLGFAYEQKGDFANAVNTYRQFMSQYPEHFLAARVQLSLGSALSKTADIAGANETLKHLVDLYPTSPWAENARQIMDKLKTR